MTRRAKTKSTKPAAVTAESSDASASTAAAPAAPGLDRVALLRALQRLVVQLEDDLRDRVARSPELDQKLKEAHSIAAKRGQTASAFEPWLDDYVTQSAVSWTLGCIFVRYLEDNDLVEGCLLAGEGERRTEAEERQDRFFRQEPTLSEREYLERLFEEVARLPSLADLFARGKNPLWGLGPSGDGARLLIQFWREIDPASGRLQRTFRSEDGDTRLLGDLYQDLSESAKKKYALLQTPVFVEEFILDRTLSPALDTFGLEKVRLIDPTCGSGHFLLGAFARLFELWQRREPGTNPRALAERAVNAVWGVDLNPFAVAIARFRLTVAASRAAGITKLKDAPHWPIHVATGDSLIHGARFTGGLGDGRSEGWMPGTERYIPQIYALEEPVEVGRILGQQYHVVVGNPPYITPKDRARREAYRAQYASCSGKYSLGVPFTERFFELALAGPDGQPAGYVGLITTNSFMKREFGAKLVEAHLPKVDLTHVLDTSGAYIPGHGTPTVILFGRNRKPVSEKVRAALGIRGEPSTPDDPAQGKVWRSIVEHIDQGAAQNEYITITDLERETLSKHPWSIGGGGAAELKERIEENAGNRLEEFIADLGRTTHSGEDEVFYLEPAALRTAGIIDFAVPLVEGEYVRDWQLSPLLFTLLPYDHETGAPVEIGARSWKCHFWRFRTRLKARKDFGQFIEERGLRWCDHSMFFRDRFRTPLSIAFAEVASHNHFVLDRGGKVFKQTAPIIKLPPGASEEDHLALLGLLNSSTACFWMKQVCFPKGGDHVGTEGARVRKRWWDVFFAFSSTPLSQFPLPDGRPLRLAQALDALGAQLNSLLPGSFESTPATAPLLTERKRKAAGTLAGMIAAQEELDWHCYQLYGFLDADLCYPGTPPPLQLGERAFEIILARKVALGEAEPTWFERHGSRPITEVPAHWPEDYRRLVERRIALIESNRDLALIEAPECKRRWNLEPWDEQETRALRSWLLDRLESPPYWPRTTPRLRSAADLADQAALDHNFLAVAALLEKRSDFDLKALVTGLLDGEAVPFLPVLRYKESGLRKRQAWEATWEKQRAEDRGEDPGPIPVPPKYDAKDFKSGDVWRLRGKLDVPRERFVSFPGLERDVDPSPVFAWAGWNHLEQAQALATYFDDRKERDGWEPARLVPILAGIVELVPWLLQWHNEVDPALGLRLGEFYRDFVPAEARKIGLTIDDARAWKPAEGKRGGRRSQKKKDAAVMDGENPTP